MKDSVKRKKGPETDGRIQFAKKKVEDQLKRGKPGSVKNCMISWQKRIRSMPIRDFLK